MKRPRSMLLYVTATSMAAVACGEPSHPVGMVAPHYAVDAAPTDTDGNDGGLNTSPSATATAAATPTATATATVATPLGPPTSQHRVGTTANAPDVTPPSVGTTAHSPDTKK